MLLTKVQKFSLYLFSKYKIDSILKIQKILFFLRVYEKKKWGKEKEWTSPIFDEENENFQAWMYGPVNVDSYYFMRPKFYGMGDESNDDILVKFKSEIEKYKKYEEKLKAYEPIITKLNEIDAQKLVYYSHHNVEYKNVRGPLKEFEPCDKVLDENKKDFILFDNEVKDDVSEILSDIK